MFDFLKRWIKNQKQKQNEYKELQTKEDAENLIQVREHNRELWFTYNNHLVCPMDMFKDSTIDAICKIREFYIERNN